ncbi:TlpA family protein disulfide reductase [Aquihabitans sp. G128]|uniref:TlpA family protein disulfide reductase n=1 Tax=Aquihabitans sp. G128 TaxID=2849779 RepID=UPI001C22386C|nr:TlpA disulfide reductase family protein [Aquihabitans sp. G128]QXC59468.1 TlpA family protein disulfide reductase [Aquihabitans sp. G128]
MDPSDETPDDAAAAEAGQAGAGAPTPAGAGGEPPAPRRRRRLDARTLAICVCVALVAAIVAGLAASALTGSDDDAANGDGDDGGIHLIDTKALLAIELTTVAGKPTTLADHLGDRPILVNLWASNCTPCIKELPLLEAASKGGAAVDFLGVDVVDQLDKAKVMASRAGVTYPWVQDPQGDFGNAVRASTIPATYLFDTDGTLLASKVDTAFKSQAELQKWIDAYT